MTANLLARKLARSQARAAGIKNVDFYLFPDTARDAATQAKETVRKLKSAGVLRGNMLWVDIEDSKLWSSSCSRNKDFLSKFIKACEEESGVKVGIYASSSQWNPIMCDTHDFKGHQLWYPHYDGAETMSDFRAFGGWARANIKQYRGTTSICGTQIDYDCY